MISLLRFNRMAWILPQHQTLCTFKRNHSNWEQIKKQKTSTDLQKSMDRTKIAMAIIKSIKSSGTADPSRNAWLNRLINIEAKGIEMPKRAIEDAIARGLKALRSGSLADGYEQCQFEGRLKQYYFLVDCVTDGKNRTEQEVRKVLQDQDAQFYDTPGHVKWMFKHVGVMEMYAPLLPNELQIIKNQFNQTLTQTPAERPIPIVPQSIDFDQLMVEAMEMGASDMHIITIPSHVALESSDIPFYALDDRLKQQAISPIQALQVICNTRESYQQFKRNLSAEIKNPRRRVRPFIHREGFMFVPDMADYESDAIWQSLHDNSDDSETILELLNKLKQIEGVVEVYHNIRQVEPWNQRYL